MVAALAAIVVLALAAAWYFQRTAAPAAARWRPTSTSGAFIQSRFELAEQSLQARQYRDAQRYADDVLTTAPGQSVGADVRDQAAAMLRQAATTSRTLES
jgi:hypothetical protein